MDQRVPIPIIFQRFIHVDAVLSQLLSNPVRSVSLFGATAREHFSETPIALQALRCQICNDLLNHGFRIPLAAKLLPQLRTAAFAM